MLTVFNNSSLSSMLQCPTWCTQIYSTVQKTTLAKRGHSNGIEGNLQPPPIHVAGALQSPLLTPGCAADWGFMTATLIGVGTLAGMGAPQLTKARFQAHLPH